MNGIRKLGFVIVSLLLAALLALACSCNEREDNIESPAPTEQVSATATSEAEATPEAETTPENFTEAPENTAAASTADPAAAATATPGPTPQVTDTPDPEVPATATPFRDTYLDLDAIRNFYVIPGEEYEFDFGDTSGWSADGRGIMTASFSGSILTVNATGTGYAKLTGPDGAVGYVYSSLAVEKTDARKAVKGYPYYLYYEKGNHVLTVYAVDSEGYYTVPVRTISAASGSTPSKTPVGTFKLGDKMRWKVFSAHCIAQYGIQYASGVFLHGPCYSEERANSILSDYYNTIGESSTGGCIRMQTANIYWIYKYCDTGTLLEIVDGSPRGLDCEKPVDIPIAACYDPTDPVLKDRK